MRLRDLRWYILASVILIISYAAIAMCYYLPVRAKAENSMKFLAVNAVKEESNILTDRVNSYYDSFIKGTLPEDSGVEYAVKVPTGGTDKFPDAYLSGKFSNANFSASERHILIASAADILNADALGNYGSDKGFYFFFQNEEAETYARISVLTLLNGVGKIEEADKAFDVFLFGSDSNLYYNSTELQTITTIGELLGNDDLSTDELGLTESNSLYKESNISINKVDGVFAASGTGFRVYSHENYGFSYLSTFIDMEDDYLAIDWVVQQAYIFYTIGVILMIVMLIILIFGCKKASVLLRCDRHGLENTNAVVIRVDKSGNVIFTNKTFKKIYGIKKLENINHFINVETNEPILANIKKNEPVECSVDIDIDSEKVAYFHLSPLSISNSYYLMGTDITLDYLRRKRLEEMSGKDENTGAPNGFTLSNNFAHIIHNSELELAFIAINIYKYEELITVFGQKNYDNLLKQFYNVLKESYPDATIYQPNNCKFMIVYPCEGIDIVNEYAHKALDYLRRPFVIKENNIYVKVKIVTYFLKHEDFANVTYEDIKNKQELALQSILNFDAKDYVVYDPAMDNIIAASDQMEKDLESGLIEKEFKMYLQPQYDVLTNKINGFEALIRWVNPKYMDKSPQTFIELAEQRGHMLEIGKFVITESFKLAKKLEPYGVHISINVSPVQIMQVAFVQQLIDEFKAAKLKKGSICIEITETFLMSNFQLVVEKLKLLKEMGFHIHLDDFCTGYSSMLYLKDLPVDTLKIDKEFTKYIETSKVHYNIVKTICELGTSLGLELICEGVESQAQSDIVKKMGCRTIQGYLICKAVPFDESIDLLNKYNNK